jgi:hypothetical protein
MYRKRHWMGSGELRQGIGRNVDVERRMETGYRAAVNG